MGASLQITGFADKVKTIDQAKKAFAEMQDQDRYENGHSYSGGIGMLGAPRFSGIVYNTVEDFEKFLENQCKGDAFMALVKVIRVTKPLTNARDKLRATYTEHMNARQAARIAGKPLTPAQIKRQDAKLDKLRAKIVDIEVKQAEKSKKTRFIVGGWCSS